MKHITEYRDREKAQALAQRIVATAGDRSMTFMEVCGTHTMSLARYGIRSLLPTNIRLISGPGCPVCVTPNRYLDHAVALARVPGVTLCTFGDMMKVPGSSTSLDHEHATGRDIRIVYSTLDALEITRYHPDRQVVFLGVGFETTAPTIAAAIRTAAAEDLKNFSVLTAHKVVPPALAALLAGPVELDGFLLPGHVSTIIGAKAYRPLLEHSRKGGVIAGFEPVDMLQAILELVRQKAEEMPALHTSYVRAVSEEGNLKAQALLEEIFEPCDVGWRGIGTIPASGLGIRAPYRDFDAAVRFDVEIEPEASAAGCRCGEVLTGRATPNQCPLFGKSCTPGHPVGACMVSGEGTCAASFKYGARDG